MPKVFLGKSLTCPLEAITVYDLSSLFKKPVIVFAFVGDSTIISSKIYAFIVFLVVKFYQKNPKSAIYASNSPNDSPVYPLYQISFDIVRKITGGTKWIKACLMR
jgi:hypothetical protein